MDTNYSHKLKEILDRCELTQEERKSFEDFMDKKVYKYTEGYEDVEDSLLIAIEKKTVLGDAQKKISGHGQWREILKLAHRMHAI